MSDRVYTLDDPRPIAAEAPYTFFLPSPQELSALAPGDLVKLIFRPLQLGDTWDSERMWVMIDAIHDDQMVGRLDNQPDEIPALQLGDIVEFERFQVIAVWWSMDRDEAPPNAPARRHYLERCLVDRCVIDDGIPVHFLDRDEPRATAEDAYPDSGWAIRGDYRGLSDAELDAREFCFVSLGLVLNRDDSWLHLIDEPIGSAFIRDWESGRFVRAG
ncbi:DUF2185 domain-containing protein [Allosphingosinicella sp.]|uniref:immunity protein Imm33 domain-containing protein n=1 Tax=Allosphingosinicella sp. TaxID=2823234 RepID=UPI003784AB4E